MPDETPDQTPDAEAALHKLGQKLREGYAAKNPTPEATIEAMKDVVTEQYEKEQKSAREKTPEPEPEKEQQRQRDEPDHDR